MSDKEVICPCDSGELYNACCRPWHAGTPAPTAEALMRSRYSAYVMGLVDYLIATWHPGMRPTELNLDLGGAPKPTWLGLTVKRHENPTPDTAVVEFVARLRYGGGSAKKMHEVSRFVREDGRWYYVDGDVD